MILPGPACTAPAHLKEGEDMLPAPASVQGCRLILPGLKKLGHHISVANLGMSGLKIIAMSSTAMRGLKSSLE